MAELEYKIIERDGDGELLDAKVFLPKLMLDIETMKQIKRMIHHPSVHHPRIMPDCHYNHGCCVGFTSVLKESLVPNFIGGDIGCGILAYQLPSPDLVSPLDDLELTEIETKIQEAVVMGSQKDCVHKSPVVTEKQLEWMFLESQAEAKSFIEGYQERFEIDLTPWRPKYNLEWFKEKCQKIGLSFEYALKSLGTLGGGNHFIEVDQGAGDQKYLTVHTGSRGFGSKIKGLHQEKINATKHFDWESYNKEMKKIKRNCKEPKRLKKLTDELREKLQAERHQNFLEKEELYEYFFDMIIAQKYAQLNRRILVTEILKQFGLEFEEENVIESVHNYIDFRDFIMRKGAIGAHLNQLCLVSLNMKEGLLLCKGKGNHDWNYSTAHGAGRKIKRSQAATKISMEEYKESMKGVVSTSVAPETLDEAPMAYKDSKLIQKAIEPSVNILDHLVPLINLKGMT